MSTIPYIIKQFLAVLPLLLVLVVLYVGFLIRVRRDRRLRNRDSADNIEAPQREAERQEDK